MARYYHGEVVQAFVDDGLTGKKLRPVIIIDRDVDSEVDEDVLVIAITTNKQRRTPRYHVMVHDRDGKDPITGLNSPSWAKCNWPRCVRFSDIRRRLGHMPDDTLERIADIFDELCNDDSFNDWQ